MLVSVTQLVDRMSGVSFSPGERQDAERVLAAVQRSLERHLNRPLEGGPRVERTFTDAQGVAWLGARPQSVTSIVLHNLAPLPDQPVLYWTVVPGGVSVGVVGVEVTISYVVADPRVNGDDLADVQARILDVAARAMGQSHDDVLTVSDLTTRNERAEGAGSPRWWQPAELAEFERLRRRVAV